METTTRSTVTQQAPEASMPGGKTQSPGQSGQYGGMGSNGGYAGTAQETDEVVNELVGSGPAPFVPADKESTEAADTPADHRSVSSPGGSVEASGDGSLDESAVDTESSFEEGWQESSGTESGAEEAEPVVEASFASPESAVGDNQREFFGAIAAALAPMIPKIIPIVKPLVSKVGGMAVNAVGGLVKNATKNLPGPAKQTAQNLIQQLLKMGVKLKLETAEEGGESGTESEEFTEESAILLAQQMEALEVIIGKDDRIQVMDTLQIPWKRICHLKIVAKTGKTYLGSGFFIGPRTIITAGHCVYLHGEGGWAKKIVVSPARNGSTTPFSSFETTRYRSVAGWVNGQQRNYDYGAIILSKTDNVSPNIGAFGFGHFTDQFLLAKMLNNAGYPGDKPSGTMWRNGRKAKAVTPRTIIYDIDSMGGQSGSPVWYKGTDGRRIVVGIHTNGATSGNSATRITKPVYDNIVRWRTEGGNSY